MTEFWLNCGFIEIENAVGVAIAAEEMGYAGVSFSDHIVHPAVIESKYPMSYSKEGGAHWDADTPWIDTWVTIGAMAAVTSHIKLGSGVMVAPMRHPGHLAKAISSAAGIAGPDRIVAGLGAGWMKEEFDFVGEDYETRGPRLEEMIVIMRKLWTGQMVEHHGTYYSFEKLQMSPPPPSAIPIWIGGNSKAAMRRAAGLDGWYGVHREVDKTVGMVNDLKRRLRENGREGEPFAIGIAGHRIDADTVKTLQDAGVNNVIAPLRLLNRDGTVGDYVHQTERRTLSDYEQVIEGFKTAVIDRAS
jgi:probable F420-dependent oxidoreductase